LWRGDAAVTAIALGGVAADTDRKRFLTEAGLALMLGRSATSAAREVHEFVREVRVVVGDIAS
jgi:hypothetical protein